MTEFHVYTKLNIKILKEVCLIINYLKCELVITVVLCYMYLVHCVCVCDCITVNRKETIMPKDNEPASVLSLISL